MLHKNKIGKDNKIFLNQLKGNSQLLIREIKQIKLKGKIYKFKEIVCQVT